MLFAAWGAFGFRGIFWVKLTMAVGCDYIANIAIEQQSWGWFAGTRLIWKKCHKKWPFSWTTFENTMIHDVFWKAAETFHLVCHPKIYTILLLSLNRPLILLINKPPNKKNKRPSVFELRHATYRHTLKPNLPSPNLAYIIHGQPCLDANQGVVRWCQKAPWCVM